MKFSLFQKKYNSFGLHLNGSALKFLQLEKRGLKSSIISYSNVTLPKNVIANDAILDSEALVDVIERSLSKPQYGRLTTNRVVVSIPESKSFIRVIQIPEMNEAQAENAVLFEAEAYIPLPMDQVYFDWQIIGRKEGKLEVLIIASPKDYVDKFITVIEKSRLKLMAVEVESQAVARALITPGSTENTLVVDLGSYKTALIMIEQGNLQFTSSVPIAGNTFTDRIAQALTVPSAKAEEIKRTLGIQNTTEYPNLKTHLLPAINDLASEVKNILNFHYDHSEAKITKLLLSGGSAKLGHLNDELLPLMADYVDLKIEIANPFSNLPGLPAVGEKGAAPLNSYEGLSFTTAIGLAMRGFEL